MVLTLCSCPFWSAGIALCPHSFQWFSIMGRKTSLPMYLSVFSSLFAPVVCTLGQVHCSTLFHLKGLILLSGSVCKLLESRLLSLPLELWRQGVRWHQENDWKGKDIQVFGVWTGGLSETVLCQEETGSSVERCEHLCLTIWRALMDW